MWPLDPQRCILRQPVKVMYIPISYLGVKVGVGLRSMVKIVY